MTQGFNLGPRSVAMATSARERRLPRKLANVAKRFNKFKGAFLSMAVVLSLGLMGLIQMRCGKMNEGDSFRESHPKEHEDALRNLTRRLQTMEQTLKSQAKATEELKESLRHVQPRAVNRSAAANAQLRGRSETARPSMRMQMELGDAVDVYSQGNFAPVGQGRRSRKWAKAPADEGKQAAVKQAFGHAWKSYVEKAFERDELMPLSGRGRDTFGGCGLTIIDSLDTLWIMGMDEEFQRARNWVANDLDLLHKPVYSVFEATIRILGGLLSAHELSGDPIFLSRAKEMADRLKPAFATPTGAPSERALRRPNTTIGSIPLADFGTQQLEWMRLSELTGDFSYSNLTERALSAATSPLTKMRTTIPHGLFPTLFDAKSGYFTNSKVTLGAAGDSFYEYLIKTWMRAGKTPGFSRYRQLYDRSVRAIANNLVNSTSDGLVALHFLEGDRKRMEMDHLACFAVGMLVLGAEGSRETEDLQLAASLGRTCYEMYRQMVTGLAPENVRFGPAQGGRLQAGVAVNMLRPEAAEAMFYLFRRTGDHMYREWGWKMFQAFERHSRVANGYAKVRDVRSVSPSHEDLMPSWFTAETLKYLYLLFSDTDLLHLDDYVFNSEAHPLQIVSRNFSLLQDLHSRDTRASNKPSGS